MKKGVLLFALFILAFTNFSVAESIYDNIPIQIQALDESGAVSAGTYTFKIDISSSSTCSPILYTNTTILTTDARGIVSYNLLDVNLNFDEQYWFCYYRDGVLKSTIKAARVPYAFNAKNVTLSGVSVNTNLDMGSYNISTDRIIVNEICNDTNCFTLGDLVSSGFFDGNYSNYSNSSFYWNDIGSFNETQMENSGGVLNILTSWLYEIFYEKEDVYNKTETYNISEVDNLISFASNSSWNQSLADTLYAGIEWDYNQTTPAIAYAESINNSLSSWINSIFAKISDVFTKSEIETGYYNKTQINDFGFVNSTDLENYNDTLYINQIVLDNNASWSSTYNSTYDSYNTTGLIKDWNSTGIIVDYNGTGYLINWNSTGLIKDWNGDIVSANTSLYDWVVSQNYLTSISEENWDGNYSTYLTLFNWNKTYADTLYYEIDNPSNFIIWGDAVNGTLALNSSLSDYLLKSEWNSTNESYYLASNPFGFYNSSNFPYTHLSNFTNDLEIENYNDGWINQTFYNKTEIISFNYYNSSNFNITDYRTLTNNSFIGDVNISGNLNVNGTNFNIPICLSGQSLTFDGSSFSCISSTSEGGTGIVESGSNTNGNYIKLADGTMIAWTTGNATYLLNSALAYNWTFPQPFISTEGIVVSITPNGNPVLNASLRPTALTYHRTSALTTTETQVGFMTNSSLPFTVDSMGGIDVMAIGRWTDLTNISINESLWAVNSTTGDIVLFNSSKNVGIGTTNPRFLLEVNGSESSKNVALFGNGITGVIIQYTT
ncbi:hypothetical protein M0R72_09505, partial [Candidatus Pacearchaeota archaeon]|nr:hypothetical protein [Candidatus Pacearchaeota archaeon]